mmetsp:Transcript_74110/g.147330  ORF Transcript_74110/g.147330 Transcript_74110/m.147330 type:complete len:184 (-) Transcript_74110:1476-2027(-)
MRDRMEKNFSTVYESDSHEMIFNSLSQGLLDLASAAIKEKGQFIVALSGGSLCTLVNLRYYSNADFSKWWVVFADERCLPLDHPDSNFAAWIPTLSEVGFQRERVIGINPELPPTAAAEEYAKRLVQISGSGEGPPVIDLCLLRMGRDGHTCSLFPGHPLLQERSKWVAAIEDSPSRRCSASH